MRKFISVLTAVLLIVSVLVVPAFAASNPTEEEITKIFRMLGVSTWGSGYFGCHMENPDGDNAPDNVVHQYIQSAGLLEDYEYNKEVTNEYGTYPEYGYELPYNTYIGIIDDCFANHSDMKSYLNNEWNNYYNEQTGIVSWPTGGFGGPSDWIVKDIYYASENFIYATGLFVDYGYEEEYFDNLTENVDYIITADGYKAMICDAILLTLKNTDGKWKILEYRENTYYVNNNVLYDLLEKQEYNLLTVEKEGAIVRANDNSTDFTFSFYANGSSWFVDGSVISFDITARKGYEVKSVKLTDSNGEKEVAVKDGVYTIAPVGTATLSVITERIPVEIEIVKPEDKEVIKVSESKTEVFAVAEQTVSEITSAITEDTEILKADGTKAEADDKIASGMQIVIKDNEGNTVDTKTVVVPGDVDGDAEIKASDARAALRASVELDKLNGWGMAAANVDGTAEIKAADARSILRASVGLEDSKDWMPSLV